MSGHSKWSNIKRKKEANDNKRGKEFSKLSRLIQVAAKKGSDIDSNPTLRLAVDKAKQANMPKDNIQKAIDKGAGETTGSDFEEITYEGYGPSGVAFMINTLTDNRNRTVAEIKNILTKAGGSLGTPGSTSYIFDSETMIPSFTVPLSDSDMEKVQKLEEALLDLDDVQEVHSNYEQ